MLNIRDLNLFEPGSIIDEKEFVRKKLVSGKRDGIKLLAHGEISFALTVKVNRISKQALQKIKNAGGKVEVL